MRTNHNGIMRRTYFYLNGRRWQETQSRDGEIGELSISYIGFARRRN